MSLVAYASSDDDSGDDEQEIETRKSGREENKGSEEWTMKASSSTKSSSFLSSLPPPKSHDRVPLPKRSSAMPEADLEDIVKPKSSFLSLPTKKKNTVKITLPDMPSADSDEEEEPSRKRPKPSGLSGLMSLLPQPKQAITKETKRPLIPHTLTKKPVQPKTKPALPRKSDGGVGSAPNKLSEDYSDDEEESGETTNFFSLGEDDDKEKQTLEVAGLKPGAAPVESIRRLPSLPAVKDNNSLVSDQNVSYNSGMTREQQEASYNNLAADSSINYSGNETQYMPDSDAPLNFRGGLTSQPANKFHNQYTAGPMYSGYDQTYDYDTQMSQELSYDSSQSEVNQYLQDEQFLRIQGKKHRGKEEINIIDVNAADQMASEIQMTRGISEEGALPVKKKNKGDLPSSQQKRKHQITYLAHQAKEREFELKNQWASNRTTKKQTQAKYGF